MIRPARRPTSTYRPVTLSAITWRDDGSLVRRLAASLTASRRTLRDLLRRPPAACTTAAVARGSGRDRRRRSSRSETTMSTRHRHHSDVACSHFAPLAGCAARSGTGRCWPAAVRRRHVQRDGAHRDLPSAPAHRRSTATTGCSTRPLPRRSPSSARRIHLGLPRHRCRDRAVTAGQPGLVARRGADHVRLERRPLGHGCGRLRRDRSRADHGAVVRRRPVVVPGRRDDRVQPHRH